MGLYLKDNATYRPYVSFERIVIILIEHLRGIEGRAASSAGRRAGMFVRVHVRAHA